MFRTRSQEDGEGHVESAQPCLHAVSDAAVLRIPSAPAPSRIWDRTSSVGLPGRWAGQGP